MDVRIAPALRRCWHWPDGRLTHCALATVMAQRNFGIITTHGAGGRLSQSLGLLSTALDHIFRIALIHGGGVAELEREWSSAHLVCGNRPALPCRSPGACFASRSEVPSSRESGQRRNELNYGQFKNVKIDPGERHILWLAFSDTPQTKAAVLKPAVIDSRPKSKGSRACREDGQASPCDSPDRILCN